VFHLNVVSLDVIEVLGKSLHWAKEGIVVALDGDILANAATTPCLFWEQDREHCCDLIQMELGVGQVDIQNVIGSKETASAEQPEKILCKGHDVKIFVQTLVLQVLNHWFDINVQFLGMLDLTIV